MNRLLVALLCVSVTISSAIPYGYEQTQSQIVPDIAVEQEIGKPETYGDIVKGSIKKFDEIPPQDDYYPTKIKEPTGQEIRFNMDYHDKEGNDHLGVYGLGPGVRPFGAEYDLENTGRDTSHNVPFKDVIRNDHGEPTGNDYGSDNRGDNVPGGYDKNTPVPDIQGTYDSNIQEGYDNNAPVSDVQGTYDSNIQEGYGNEEQLTDVSGIINDNQQGGYENVRVVPDLHIHKDDKQEGGYADVGIVPDVHTQMDNIQPGGYENVGILPDVHVQKDDKHLGDHDNVQIANDNLGNGYKDLDLIEQEQKSTIHSDPLKEYNEYDSGLGSQSTAKEDKSFLEKYFPGIIGVAKSLKGNLHSIYENIQQKIPRVWQKFKSVLSHFGLTVHRGAEYVGQRISYVFGEVHAADLITRLENKLQSGDEIVDAFFQKVGEKMTRWRDQHGHVNVDSGLLPQDKTNVGQEYLDPTAAVLFQDQDIHLELKKLVKGGILKQEEMDILSGTKAL